MQLSVGGHGASLVRCGAVCAAGSAAGWSGGARCGTSGFWRGAGSRHGLAAAAVPQTDAVKADAKADAPAPPAAPTPPAATPSSSAAATGGCKEDRRSICRRSTNEEGGDGQADQAATAAPQKAQASSFTGEQFNRNSSPSILSADGSLPIDDAAVRCL